MMAGKEAAKNKLLFALKLTVTVLLCTAILWNADWNALARGFQDVNLLLLCVVFLCMTLCVTLSAYKWQVLLRIHGAPFTFSRLHKYYFIAMFFNNFLPTSIGGDGYRIYKTLNNKRSKTSAVVAVLVERISGILSLLALGFLGGAVGYLLHHGILSRSIMYVGIGAMVVGIPVMVLLSRESTHAWLRQRKRFPRVLRQAMDHFGDYRREPVQSLWVVVISFGFHAFSLFWIWLLIVSAGGSLAIYDLAVVAALLSIVAILPLSINGIGLVDGSFIYLAGQFGLGYETALTVMLLQRALLIPISLVGGILYTTERKDLPTEDALEVDALSSEEGSVDVRN